MIVASILMSLSLAQATGIPVEAGGELLNEGTCGAVTGEEELEMPWALHETPQGVRLASKQIVVPFATWDEGKIALPGDGDPEIGFQNCSSGVCTVVVHVYEETITSYKAHVGAWAFLGWGYMKAQLRQTVEVTTETEIACEGETFVVLTGSGGTGPRLARATIWESQETKQGANCAYANIPALDEECNMILTAAFNVDARTPGKHTRFDIVNGGTFHNELSAYSIIGGMETAPATIDVTPEESVDVRGICLTDCRGAWKTVFAGIDVSVDTEEAVALLAGN